MLSQLRYLHRDLGRWKVRRPRDLLYDVFLDPAVWPTVFNRISRALYLIRIYVLTLVFRLFALILFRLLEVPLRFATPASCEIGPGLFIGNSGYVGIYHGYRIGEKPSIIRGNISGQKSLGSPGVSSIGSNMSAGVGVEIL